MGPAPDDSLFLIWLADHYNFLYMKCRLTTELEGDSQDLREQLLQPHKTKKMEEVQAEISQSHQEDEAVWSEQGRMEKQREGLSSCEKRETTDKRCFDKGWPVE